MRKNIFSFWIGIFIIAGVLATDLHAQEQESNDETDNVETEIDSAAFVFTPSDKYAFIKYEQNKLLFANTLHNTFEKLYKLEKYKSGKVHFLHIGDSHIQADIFTGRVRDNFIRDNRFPVNTRGFIYPYKAAQTNNPWNYSVSVQGIWQGARCVKSTIYSRWGLAGVTALTLSAESTLSINANPDENGKKIFSITKVKIFYPNTDPSQFYPVLMPEAGNQIINEIVGDGFVEYILAKPQYKISIGLQKMNSSQNRFLLQGIMTDNDQPGVIYSASGVNGAEAKHYLRCEDFTTNLKAIAPDVVIISLGTNDAYPVHFDTQFFEANYKYIIAKVRANLPECDIILATPGDNMRRVKYQNKNNEIAAKKLIEIAKQTDCAVWDFYTIMGGFRSIDKWYLAKLTAKDKLHFSVKGYRLQGDLFFEAISGAFEEYRKTK
jgi:lysophospholipase L1-like esterase